jgi:hypothetical protein
MNRLMRLGAATLPLLIWTSRTEAAAGWSVLSGRTVGIDQNVIHGQVGWPGISATLLHGMTPKVDIGGAFAFNYGVEGSTYVYPELTFRAVGRLNLKDTPKYNIGLGTQPGLLLVFPGSGFGAQVGIGLPVSFAAGFPVSRELTVVAGADIAFDIFFTSPVYAVIPILFGGGLEYMLEPNLLLTFNLRLGPIIYTGGGYSGSGAVFGLNALIGLAYRF